MRFEVNFPDAIHSVEFPDEVPIDLFIHRWRSDFLDGDALFMKHLKQNRQFA